MIITQKKYRKLREAIDCIQFLICDLKLRGICIGCYQDCYSNALYLISHRLDDLGKDSHDYIYEITVPPYNYGMPERKILKIKWKSIDDSFKEATQITLDKIRYRVITTINNDLKI